MLIGAELVQEVEVRSCRGADRHSPIEVYDSGRRLHTRFVDLSKPILEIRPTFRKRQSGVPPSSVEARNCTYECTFRADCADVLVDVCPNCGGGFVARNPSKASTGLFVARDLLDLQETGRATFLGKDPATTAIQHRGVDPLH